jgi:hypothetical protein
MGIYRPSVQRQPNQPQADQRGTTHPQSMAFEDDGRFFLFFRRSSSHLPAVPIYDARKHNRFAFRFTDLQEISKLPRFKNGKADLPIVGSEEYVVAVGYTAGTFTYNGSNSLLRAKPSVTMNVIFVVVLGRLKKKAE